jgi:hypothetical protein
VLLTTAQTDGSGNLPATAATIPSNTALGTHQVVVRPASGQSAAGVTSISVVTATLSATPVAGAVTATPTFTG